MAGKRLDVLYCVLNALTRRYGPRQVSDLLGMDYHSAVPPDTEFPNEIRRLDLFTRFFLAGVGPTELAIRITRYDSEGEILEVVNDYRFLVPDVPSMRVDDHVFRLTHTRLTGTGMYSIRTLAAFAQRWKGLRWQKIGPHSLNSRGKQPMKRRRAKVSRPPYPGEYAQGTDHRTGVRRRKSRSAPRAAGGTAVPRAPDEREPEPPKLTEPPKVPPIE